MLPTNVDNCDDDAGCIPDYIKNRRGLSPHHATSVFFSSLPFIITFLIVSTAVLQKFFPLLTGQISLEGEGHEHQRLPAYRGASRSPSRNRFRSRITAQRLAAWSFSTTLALTAVLAELILCEISNTLNPIARGLALRVTVSTLLLLLIVVTPLLELHSMIKTSGWGFRGDGRGRSRMGWILEVLGFSLWIAGFWWVGQGLPGTPSCRDVQGSRVGKTLSEACLERVGIIGVSLMALLSGFASVSTPWENFGAKTRPVTESDIARRQAGLEATNEMLAAKTGRLRALGRKLADAPQEGFMTKVMGTIRGNADAAELKSLQLEISGLETMRLSLSTSLSMLRHRHTTQRRSSTPLGRLLALATSAFSLYCLYRILATSLATLRRWWSPDATSFAQTDPINNLLALVAKHWDPSLDRAAWARTISFLLSGVILAASFSSIIQTIHFLSRVAPAALFTHTQANLALLVSQVSATYVISSALLLRSNLPQEVGSVISEALGAPLEPRVVDRWFEGWFLIASAATAVGILLVRKVGGTGEWGDEFDFGERDVEMGGSKRS